MSIYRDKKRGCFVFEFSRTIEGQRVRSTKSLPRSWNQAQADAYDRQESAKLYAIATRVECADFLIEDAVEKYVAERCPELKHGKGCALELQDLMPFYVGRPLTSLVDVCKAIRLKSVKRNGEPLAPATITNRIRYLTAACRYGWKHHSMGLHDPAAGVVTPVVRNQRNGYITRQQMIQVAMRVTNKEARAAIRILFYTGMRIGELQRAEIIGSAYVLRDTKNGDPRIIPIHPKIRCCLKFKVPSKFTVRYHLYLHKSEVGIPWVHVHDIRHSCASAMINSGVDLYTVGAVLGHKSQASTQRYSHLATDRLSAAIFKIGKVA
jgi:integrase